MSAAYRGLTPITPLGPSYDSDESTRTWKPSSRDKASISPKMSP